MPKDRNLNVGQYVLTGVMAVIKNECENVVNGFFRTSVTMPQWKCVTCEQKFRPPSFRRDLHCYLFVWIRPKRSIARSCRGNT
jgi:hypothetical protein